MVIKPQPGAQEKFLASSADIVVYGGAAGGGKTFSLLLECLRHSDNPDFNAVVFRRQANQITNAGGLWDTAVNMYSPLGASFKTNPSPQVTFPSGAKINFNHLQLERDVYSWQGAQIALLCCEIDTDVLMADGTYKKVAHLKVGDRVKTLQGIETITAVGDVEEKDCVVAELEDGTKQIQSVNHDILTLHGWISYEKLFSESTQCCSIRESFGCKHSLSDDTTCKGLPSNNLDLEPPRQSSSQSPGCYQSVLEQCAYHTSRESHRVLTFSPIQSCYDDKFAERCHRRHQSSEKSPCNRSGHPQHNTLSSLLEPGHRGVQENGGHKALSVPDNACEAFQQQHQNIERCTLCHAFPEVADKVQGSIPHGLSTVSTSGGQLDVQNETAQLDSQCDCLVCSRFYDEPVQNFSKIDQDGVLQLNDVVVHIPTDSHLGDSGITHRRSYHRLRYFHPYTEEESQSSENCQIQSLKITPCGKRLVRNITVSSTNHYITKSGLINKNCFDELTHFTEKQFVYMMSRNRSLCGVKPYIRATTNPDADSWVADFLSWWIDQETGYPIVERSGVIRYFYRLDGSFLWGDTVQELVDKYSADPKLCKSVTFIASSIYDNKILLEANPEYLANLNGLDIVEKERLLKGNWKIRPSAGLYFKRENIRIVQTIPERLISVCRSWDLAATEITTENKNPDRTAGVLMGRLKSGEFIVLDVIRRAANAADVRRMILQTAKADRADYGLHTITLPQDPGQAGKDQAATYIKALAGYKVRTAPVTGSKIVRAVPFSAQWQGGNVLLLAGDWNKEYLQEMEGFPDALHDDMVDASSDAFKNVANAADWSALIS